MSKKNLSMGCPTVNKFLCCMSLETGGFIIGWTNIIVGALALVGMITLLSLLVVDYVHFGPPPDQGVIGGFIGDKNIFVAFA